MRYLIAIVSWTLLAFPAPHHPAPVRGAAPTTNWSRASQGLPAFGDAGPIH
jgi:hypothetical protein